MASRDMLYYVGVRAIIRNGQGCILLLQMPRPGTTNDTYWDLPGGRVQEGENLIHALQREVEEEAGIYDLFIEQSIGTMLTPIRLKVPGADTVGLLFVVYKATSTVGTTSPEAGVQAHWLAPRKAAKLLGMDPNIPPELIAEVMNS